ncbi:hypothetical protein AABB24_002725, partial [Solanum stoloniferum]
QYLKDQNPKSIFTLLLSFLSSRLPSSLFSLSFSPAKEQQREDQQALVASTSPSASSFLRSSSSLHPARRSNQHLQQLRTAARRTTCRRTKSATPTSPSEQQQHYRDSKATGEQQLQAARTASRQRPNASIPLLFSAENAKPRVSPTTGSSLTKCR